MQTYQSVLTQLFIVAFRSQLFMIGLFTLDGAWTTSALTTPLLAATVLWTYHVHHKFKSLCENVSLSLIAEVQRGEGPEEVMRVSGGQHEGDVGVTRSQT